MDHLQEMLVQLDPEAASLHSYTNYHTEGLIYLNLHRTPQLTEKLYYVPVDFPTQGKWRAGVRIIVNPHTHNYNFRTTLVAGRAANHIFNEVDGDTWTRYNYRSPLNQGDGFRRDRKVGLVQTSITQLVEIGDSYYLDTNVIHSISLNAGTLLYLQQYKDRTLGNLFYTEEDTPPSLDNLYKPMTVEQCRVYRDKFLEIVTERK